MRLPRGPARPNELPVRCVAPAIAEVLRASGYLPLHASSVVANGRAYVFAGKSGSGKSTIAAALLDRGCEFLADDRVLIVDGIVRPSFELPNPFARWVGHTPESGPRPRILHSDPNASAPLAKIFFPRVEPSGISAMFPLAGAETAARLGVLHPPAPGFGLTLGREVSKILDDLIQ